MTINPLKEGAGLPIFYGETPFGWSMRSGIGSIQNPTSTVRLHAIACFLTIFALSIVPLTSEVFADPSQATFSVADGHAQAIILFIGDGMGDEHRKAGRWASVGQSGQLAMDDLLYQGWLQTASADNPITDSAAWSYQRRSR
jgi:alkaline phosphatase